jgi:carbamoyl-phosphate synthase large subunit
MNILVTAAGCPGFITICKAIRSSPLPNSIIHGCDMNNDAVGLYFADKSFVVPRGDSEDYISIVKKYCIDNNINLIIPASDTELLPLSLNRETFESIGCKILVAPQSSLESILDKSFLYKECKKNNDLKKIIPHFNVCSNTTELKLAYDNIASSFDNVCVKPARAHGSRGFRIISSIESKKEFFSNKPSASKISFESLYKIMNQGSEDFPSLLVMEYLSGEEFSVDCVSYNGKFHCVTRRRDIIKDGICSSGTVVKKQDLIDLSEIIYKNFGLKFNANIQFKYDSSGNPKLLEINPRVSGTMELCRGAGVNFVYAAIADSLNLNLPVDYFSVNWGTRMERVWEEIFYNEEKAFMLESTKSVLPLKATGN